MLKAAQLVLKVGTDVNAIDANGDTATHAAVLKNLSTVVQVQADPSAKFDLWNRRNWHDWTLFPIAEGHRPDHFKPSEETIVAVQKVLLTAGVVPLAEGARGGLILGSRFLQRSGFGEVLGGKSQQNSILLSKTWCRGRDSNPHFDVTQTEENAVLLGFLNTA